METAIFDNDRSPTPDDDNTLTFYCTVCTSPVTTPALHPLLKTLVCETCKLSYEQTDFKKLDEEVQNELIDFGQILKLPRARDGELYDKLCRWCMRANTGINKLYGCEYDFHGIICNYSFCEICIKRNIHTEIGEEPIIKTESLFTRAVSGQSLSKYNKLPLSKPYKWFCFFCDWGKLVQQRKFAQNAIEEINKRELEKRAERGVESSDGEESLGKQSISSTSNDTIATLYSAISERSAKSAAYQSLGAFRVRSSSPPSKRRSRQDEDWLPDSDNEPTTTSSSDNQNNSDMSETESDSDPDTTCDTTSESSVDDDEDNKPGLYVQRKNVTPLKIRISRKEINKPKQGKQIATTSDRIKKYEYRGGNQKYTRHITDLQAGVYKVSRIHDVDFRKSEPVHGFLCEFEGFGEQLFKVTYDDLYRYHRPMLKRYLENLTERKHMYRRMKLLHMDWIRKVFSPNNRFI